MSRSMMVGRNAMTVKISILETYTDIFALFTKKYIL